MRWIDLKAAATVSLLLLSSGSTPMVAFAQQQGTPSGTTTNAPGAPPAGATPPQRPATQTQSSGSGAPAQAGGQAGGQTGGQSGQGASGAGSTQTNSPAQPNGGSQTNPTAPAPIQPVQNDTTGTPGLPQAPQPKLTEPFDLRDTDKNYTHLKKHTFHDPIAPYTSTQVPLPRLGNTPTLYDLLQGGRLMLSLDDAIRLALENNYDIAIARINLDIADTDILRTESGLLFRGVSSGLVTGTLGGTTSTITGGGGPGGTSTSTGGAGTGANGLVLSTNGGGPQPYNFDPIITGTAEYERATTQTTSQFTNGGTTATLTGDLKLEQGFSTGTLFDLTFNNTRQTTTNPLTSYSPLLDTNFRAQITQHLLQGFGPRLNKRFIVEAKNNRRITDSGFRQQVIYTVTQVESIYWSLVSAYEDEQSKERALAQSTSLALDNRKQLQIGTLAPLDVVNSDSAVSTDKQSLITSKSNLEYQQLLMKQAIARNLNDPQLTAAPVIPTDRVSLARLPEEDLQVEDLVKIAFTNNPQVEQAVLTEQNNKITIQGERNGLLPVVDAFGFYGASALAGQPNPDLVVIQTTSGSSGPPAIPNGYNGAIGSLFTNKYPDYAVGVNVTIPLRNRAAQADQARSQMEYRQSQMRLQQLYTQLRIQVINQQYALTNDRANVVAAQTARDFNAQSLDAEQRKYKLGASTTANVLSQERTLATGEDNLIAAQAAYAKDRSILYQILSTTLDQYGIALNDAATGTVTQKPMVPGLTPPQPPAPPRPLTETPPPLPQ